MGKTTKTILIIHCFLISLISIGQSASFNAPDTVCISQPLNINNTSTASTNYYWNFCVADLKTAPNGVNLGNINGELSAPVFMDYVFTNGNYYGFLTNYNPGELIRLDFGNSLLNTPIAVNLGGFGGIIPAADGAEGIQIVNNEGKWYAIIVGGYTAAGYNPRILKIAFGADITNPTPVATSWGNIGGLLQQPIDLHVFKENDNWYGFTVNSQYNTITRFNFTNSFENTPTAENLGNLGNLAYPTGIYAVKNNTDWNVFIVNGGNSSMTSGTWSLTRLNFGSSLLNTPTAVNLGNPGGVLKHPRDLTIMKSCGQTVGFVVNGHPSYNNIVTLDFNNDLNSTPQGKTLGNIGQLNFPHSISKLFRVGDELYGFITNVRNNTITRLQFSGCNNSSLKSSNEKDPPPITFDKPGTYQINLTIDDGLPTQSSYCKQVIVIPEPIHTPLQTFTIEYGEKIKIGTGNLSQNYKWNNGETADSILVSDGLYYVETAGYGCKNIDSFLVKYKNAFDFSYKQNPCSPLNIQFTDYDNETKDNFWSFGDGVTVTDQANPTHQYSLTGTYTVKYVLRNVAADTIIKNIQFNVEQDDIIITPDTTICNGSSLQLLTKPTADFCWKPIDFLDNPNSPNPISSPTEPIIYHFTGIMNGENLIRNGDFSSGNQFFGTDYQYAATNTSNGQYFVGTSSSTWNNQFNNCTDKSSGSGNMLMIQGTTDTKKVIWTQMIGVTPNTNYSFSAWIQTLSSRNNLDIGLRIDDHTIENLDESLTPCNWKNIQGTWNSGDKTKIFLGITNRNNQMQASDFALDDMSFSPILIKEEFISINIDKPVLNVAGAQTVCTGSTVDLNASGAQSYTWTPGSLILNPNEANAKATVYETTKFYVEAKTDKGCLISDSLVVKTYPLPTFIKTNDTLICANSTIQLKIEGGSTYSWTPAGTLDNASVSNPKASPVSDTKYMVSILDQFACEYADSIQVNIKPEPQFNVSPSSSICAGEPVALWADGGDLYEWTPSGMVDNANISDPIANIDNETTFKVRITELQCNQSTELSTTIKILPNPQITASSSNDIDCSTSFSQLMANGGTGYEWWPVEGLDFADKANPIARPLKTTIYIVTGRDQNGCYNKDSVTIEVNFTGVANNFIYNAFSPNNDGLNDCFGIKHLGNVEALNFSIYNRWGQKIFQTNNSNACWDGKYKGINQEAGVYIYQITGKTICENVNLKGTFMLIR